MKAEVILKPDNIEFMTKTNGDRIRIQGIHFTAQDASNLARMINDQNKLKLIIKTLNEGEQNV